MAQVPSEEVARYIPALETLRAAGSELEIQTWRHPFGVDLLEREPTETRRLAAVVLVARVLRRTIEDTEALVRHTEIGELPEKVPALADDWTSRVSRVLLARVPGGSVRCPYCETGCFSCADTGLLQPMRVRMVQDIVETLRYAYVPSLPFSIEERVTKLVEPTADPPECLRFDMAPRRAGSAYRDVVEVDPEFFGHSFADALVEARRAAQALVGGDTDVVRKDVRAYAWPVLLLRWDEVGLQRTVAVVVRPSDLAHVAIVQ